MRSHCNMRAFPEISANLVFKDGTAHCRGTTHAYTGYTVKLVMVLKRSNVEYARWEETVTAGGILLEEICNITHGHVYQVVVTAYVYNSAGSWWRHRQLKPPSKPINTTKTVTTKTNEGDPSYRPRMLQS